MAFIVILIAAICIAYAATHIPLFCQKFVCRNANELYQREISLLPSLYEKCVIVISERRGEGGSCNSDVVFAQAHDHQNYAMNSILELMEYLEA